MKIREKVHTKPHGQGHSHDADPDTNHENGDTENVYVSNSEGSSLGKGGKPKTNGRKVYLKDVN